MPWLLKQKKEKKKRESKKKKHKRYKFSTRTEIMKYGETSPREMVIAEKAEDACRGCLPRMRRVFLKTCE